MPGTAGQFFEQARKAVDAREDVENALDAGATLLRRWASTRDAHLTAGERSTLVHKGLELDLARSMVTNTQTGTSTELTKNELRILSLLLSRAGKIVSRSAIMQDLWDSDAFVDDNTLTVNINRLRTTLEKIGIKGYLTTHRGQGYSV